jgi:hypothetical protein
VARGKRPASRRHVFLPGARQNVCGATTPCAGRRGHGCSCACLLQCAAQPSSTSRHEYPPSKVVVLVYTDVLRGDVHNIGWGSAGRFVSRERPEHANERGRDAVGAEDCWVYVLEQQRRERDGMSPVSCAQKGEVMDEPLVS